MSTPPATTTTPTPAPTARPTPDNHVIVIFGITGDLARRKILPGLYHLAVAGLLPENCLLYTSQTQLDA